MAIVKTFGLRRKTAEHLIFRYNKRDQDRPPNESLGKERLSHEMEQNLLRYRRNPGFDDRRTGGSLESVAGP